MAVKKLQRELQQKPGRQFRSIHCVIDGHVYCIYYYHDQTAKALEQVIRWGRNPKLNMGPEMARQIGQRIIDYATDSNGAPMHETISVPKSPSELGVPSWMKKDDSKSRK
jgi:hypothetical protein